MLLDIYIHQIWMVTHTLLTSHDHWCSWNQNVIALWIWPCLKQKILLCAQSLHYITRRIWRAVSIWRRLSIDSVIWPPNFRTYIMMLNFFITLSGEHGKQYKHGGDCPQTWWFGLQTSLLQLQNLSNSNASFTQVRNPSDLLLLK